MNAYRSLVTFSVGILVLMSPSVSWGVVYELDEHVLPNGYGFSGTITTNGSIGFFDDPTALVTDWNIVLSTPGGMDGITSQILTSSNSVLSCFGCSTGGLGTGIESSLTSLSVRSDFGELTRFVFEGRPIPAEGLEVLEFNYSGSTSGSITVLDSGEASPQGFVSVPTLGGPFAIATAVPEPSSILFLGLAALGVAARRRQ